MDTLPAGLVLQFGEMRELTVWGTLAWKAASGPWHRALRGPFSPKVVYDQKFCKAAAALSVEDRAELHAHVGALGHHLDDARVPLPKAATFKALAGNAVPGATHELYVTSRSPARRAFGRFENGVFRLLDIDTHL